MASSLWSSLPPSFLPSLVRLQVRRTGSHLGRQQGATSPTWHYCKYMSMSPMSLWSCYGDLPYEKHKKVRVQHLYYVGVAVLPHIFLFELTCLFGRLGLSNSTCLLSLWLGYFCHFSPCLSCWLLDSRRHCGELRVQNIPDVNRFPEMWSVSLFWILHPRSLWQQTARIHVTTTLASMNMVKLLWWCMFLEQINEPAASSCRYHGTPIGLLNSHTHPQLNFMVHASLGNNGC